MAKSKQGDNRDALGSIFDFIFAESQKPPEKRKPVRYSNVHGTSEMVDALASVLEKPGLYVSDQVLKNLDDGLNVQLGEMYLGKSSPQSKTKIYSKDLLKMFSDPNGFFDKAYQKANPKFNMAQWSGKSYRGIVAASWAKKQGIADEDTRWALNRAAAAFDNPADRFDMVVDGQRLGRKAVALQAIYEGMKGYNGDVVNNIGKMIESTNIRNKNDLQNLLMTRAGISDMNLINKILSNYNEGKISSWDKKLEEGFKSKPKYGNKQNLDTYRDITGEFFSSRKNILSRSSNQKDLEKSKDFEKASNLVKNWNRDDNRHGEVILENKKALKKVESEIKMLKRNGVRTSAEKVRLKELNEAKRRLNSSLNMIRSNDFQDNYNKYKGMWTSLNNIYLKGNLAGSILDGTFFSDDNKLFNPVNPDWKGYTSFITNRKDEHGDPVYDSPILFNLPDKDGFFTMNGGFRRKETSFYNSAMTSLSYMTPQKFFQINGEYWAYRTYKNKMKMFEKLMNSVSDQEAFAKILTDKFSFFDGSGNLNFGVFEKPDVFEAKMKEFREFMAKDAELSKQLAVFDKFIKLDQRFVKLTNYFSIGYRFKERIKDSIQKGTIDKLRDWFMRPLTRWFGADDLLGPALRQWGAGGSIQGLMRAVAEKIFSKLGFSGFLLKSVLAPFVGGIFASIAYNFFKFLAKVAVVALIGLAVIVLWGGAFSNSLSVNYGSTGYITPGENIECEGFTPEELANVDEVDIDIPVPSNASCPLGTGTLVCNQGYKDGRGSFSHTSIRSLKPVDIDTSNGAYFYAPQYCDDGGCKITSIRSAALYVCKDHSKSAGDEVRFDDGQGNVFILVHAKALVAKGKEVSGGDPVAYIYGDGELPSGNCWDGGHLHLEITHNGSYVDPLAFLQALGCNAPDESQCKN